MTDENESLGTIEQSDSYYKATLTRLLDHNIRAIFPIDVNCIYHIGVCGDDAMF